MQHDPSDRQILEYSSNEDNLVEIVPPAPLCKGVLWAMVLSILGSPCVLGVIAALIPKPTYFSFFSFMLTVVLVQLAAIVLAYFAVRSAGKNRGQKSASFFVIGLASLWLIFLLLCFLLDLLFRY